VGQTGGFVPRQSDGLTHLDLILQLALEATEEDFALARFQTINHRRNGTNVVSHREENEFAINKVIIGYFIQSMINKCARLDIKKRQL
jgi:hypothetical protein